MRKIFIIILLFVISTGIALSDCALNSCNQGSKKVNKELNKPNIKKIFSNNSSFSTIKNIEKQIIASVNNQVSKINTDLSLAYRKKTLSIRYNINNQLPEVNSYISISYGKKAISLNYTIAIW